MKNIFLLLVIAASLQAMEDYDTPQQITPAMRAIYQALVTDDINSLNQALANHGNTKEHADYALGKTFDILKHLNNRTTIVQELLSRQANPNPDISKWGGCHPNSAIFASYILRAKEYPEIIDLLLKNKFDTNVRDPITRNTPLMIAALYKYNVLGEKLLHNNADTTLKNSKGLTALEIAEESGNSVLAELIKEKK